MRGLLIGAALGALVAGSVAAAQGSDPHLTLRHKLRKPAESAQGDVRIFDQCSAEGGRSIVGRRRPDGVWTSDTVLDDEWSQIRSSGKRRLSGAASRSIDHILLQPELFTERPPAPRCNVICHTTIEAAGKRVSYDRCQNPPHAAMLNELLNPSPDQ